MMTDPELLEAFKALLAFTEELEVEFNGHAGFAELADRETLDKTGRWSDEILEAREAIAKAILSNHKSKIQAECDGIRSRSQYSRTRARRS